MNAFGFWMNLLNKPRGYKSKLHLLKLRYSINQSWNFKIKRVLAKQHRLLRAVLSVFLQMGSFN